MKNRTAGREIALHYLYEQSVVGPDLAEELDAFLSRYDDPEPARVFAVELIRGVAEHGKGIDTEIVNAAINWEIGRIAIIDRNILRIGIYEILYREDIPLKVTINEAIELAKKYSSSESGAFVNGILDTVRKKAGGTEE